MATPNTVNPAQPRLARSVDELSDEIIQQREECGDPDSMLQMMDSFQATAAPSTTVIDNPPQLKQTGFYYKFSKSMRVRKAFSVNSRTAFFEEVLQDIYHGRSDSGNQVQLTECKQNPCIVLTDHDEAYACWHPEATANRQKEQHIGEVYQHSLSARELEFSISACGVRNRAQRSVSFVGGPTERTSTRQQFAVYRNSTSLFDPIFPSSLISPRLRGLSFSKEFEEHMLALPVPPVEHSVSFASPRSSTVSTTPSGNCFMIALLLKKRKGFWAKLGAPFKACFGAR